jgi:hypothetical protein
VQYRRSAGYRSGGDIGGAARRRRRVVAVEGGACGGEAVEDGEVGMPWRARGNLLVEVFDGLNGSPQLFDERLVARAAGLIGKSTM